MINSNIISELTEDNSNGILVGDAITALIQEFIALTTDPETQIPDNIQIGFIKTIINLSNNNADKINNNILTLLSYIYDKLNGKLSESQKQIQINQKIKDYGFTYIWDSKNDSLGIDLLYNIMDAEKLSTAKNDNQITVIKEIISFYNLFNADSLSKIRGYILEKKELNLFKDSSFNTYLWSELEELETIDIQSLYSFINFIIIYYNSKEDKYTTEIIDISQHSECDYDELTIKVRQSWLNIEGNAEIREKQFVVKSNLYYDVKEKIYKSELNGQIIWV